MTNLKDLADYFVKENKKKLSVLTIACLVPENKWASAFSIAHNARMNFNIIIHTVVIRNVIAQSLYKNEYLFDFFKIKKKLSDNDKEEIKKNSIGHKTWQHHNIRTVYRISGKGRKLVDSFLKGMK